ncbi:MAG: phosphatase PAP2 family protein [Nocardioides sp.]
MAVLDLIPRPVMREAVRRARPTRGQRLVELGLLVVLYVAYSGSRLLASDDLGAAQDNARALVRWERAWHLDVERTVEGWFLHVPALGLAGSYYYATAHYLVTLVVVVWLHRRGGSAYLRSRNALVVATVAGLVCYLLLPVAPPRLAGLGHADVMEAYAASGWWGGQASAPRGLGEYTNELAAMPSLHAGWALWVLLAVAAAGAPVLVRRLALAHVLLTAVVVVGTGNHWVVDVLAGWLLVGAAAYVVGLLGRGRRSAPPMPASD